MPVGELVQAGEMPGSKRRRMAQFTHLPRRPPPEHLSDLHDYQLAVVEIREVSSRSLLNKG